MSMVKFFKSVLILAVMVIAAGAFAAPWFSNGPKRELVTLIITGNYKSTRLMADLILNESRQPHILLPPEESEQQKIIYVQASGPAREIAENQFNRIVRLLNPQRIVVLGDDRYVPPKYIKMLDRTIPIIRVEGSDWNKVAEQLTFLLNLSNLGSDYKRLREEMNTSFRPTVIVQQSVDALPAVNADEAPAIEAEAPAAAEEAPAVEAEPAK